MDTYQIMLGDKSVGKAWVTREGLYYRIRCRCALSGETVCRIQVRCNGRMEDLGILVPEDGEFVLKTRIPVKRIGEGDFAFSVGPQHRAPETAFVPLYPQEPFRYITGIKAAYLERRNGQTGVVIKKSGRD